MRSRNDLLSTYVRLVVTFLAAQNIGLASASSEKIDPAWEQEIDKIRQFAPADFTALLQPPFIVVGDEPPAIVRQRAEGTVKRTVDRLKQDFFANDPTEIVTIWLFKDKESYETNTRRLFHEVHPSPYGYYSPIHRALIMNISTGSGTLVHEIVHPYMRANFPNCPAWFNEGMGSLFEQSEDRTGRIHGLPNWRLPGLQTTIRNGKTLPFEEFTAMSDTEFYGGSSGYNQHYGQARYLCYYLQERDLLVKYYQLFQANAQNDPTGVRSLKKILGTDDLVGFRQQWETFVLELRYP